MGPFALVSDGSDIPVFTWTLKEKTNFTLFDLSEMLRHRGWQVPAYTLPENSGGDGHHAGGGEGRLQPGHGGASIWTTSGGP